MHLILALGARLLLSSLLGTFVFNLSTYIHFPVPAPIGRATVSNVTSTGFHVAWVTDLALRPTFQLTLRSMRSPAVHLETRNTSLQLWGLEPGVLHLVEIVAKACGEESARVQLKVRTGNTEGHLLFKGGKTHEKGFWWVPG